MAMTTCPNCGEQISDKAKKCVHCGTVLVPEKKEILSGLRSGIGRRNGYMSEMRLPNRKHY